MGELPYWNRSLRRSWGRSIQCAHSKRGSTQAVPLLHLHLTMEAMEDHSEPQEDSQLGEVYEAPMDPQEDVAEENQDNLTAVSLIVPKMDLTESKSATVTT